MTAEEIAALRARSADQPHYGYTRDVQESRNVADQLIAVRAQLGRQKASEVTFMPRPRMFADLIDAHESALTRADLDDAIDQAHANAERFGLN
ncbi:hypothetical protein [Mycolicibacter arupensis]|jgi:hypothetical protein|uniref:Uncharacterized protein n=2 Tax=Mycolicibacter arupensis TaxID=342002 RepID=A0A0F5MXQ1_9MYCO|nr:hypothetical protein [Mycolicibacter arupensis]KKB99476.1 hypothetical protein WR43_09695 [Mycolicibacter arupensis]MCV7277095.1 hypothetical protein [Mycolicibacter arupensis]OQZ93676.1 hypothetical protein BST15_17545 [Mycolicibacter arupensis]TXI54437.1 MAG: hypothetical protein E6Q54_14640 [Mycolicibacter arupensis]